jgi:hypothetical protein
MSVLASDVMVEAAALCGDRAQTLYTNAKLLPLLNRSQRELSQQLANLGINLVEKEWVSGIVAAHTYELTGLPADFGSPIDLWERDSLSTNDEDWIPMTEKEWDPSDSQGVTLGVWKFQEGKIKLRGATTARTVRLHYAANLASLPADTAAIPIVNSEHFLAAKTASYAARFIGKNVTLGAQLNGDAQEALDLLLGIRTKEDQNVVLRMLPYSLSHRRG